MQNRPMFQRYHYAEIAALLADFAEKDNSYAIVKRFADMFARDNPRFDRRRFIDAAAGQPSNYRDKRD